MPYEDVSELSYEPQWREAAKRLYKGAGWTQDPDAPLFDIARADELLKGAIDVHVHSGPDAYVARPFDEDDIGIQASQIGMSAVVFKCFSSPTARSAKIAQKAVDQWAKEHGKESTRLIGGVVLGYAVGGLNPEAVRTTARFGGKFVWTPGRDSSHHHKVLGQEDGIEVIDKHGRVVPELREIFEIIVKYDMVLSLCHHNTRERFIMIDEAREMGVKRIEIVHPTESIVKMSIDQMKTAAKKGAYLGLYYIAFQAPEVPWEGAIETIKEVGADHFVLGTDAGNWIFPPPAAVLRIFLGRLLSSGIPEADVEKMVKINPQKLIS